MPGSKAPQDANVEPKELERSRKKPHGTTTEPEAPPELDQPGLSVLRSAVANHWRPRLPGFAALRRDGVAGLSNAISNVPDGMANATILGVNPVHGLYATILGPGVGGLFSSTQLMMITTTAAASLSTAQSLGGLQGEERASALFAMVLLVGVFQVVSGLLDLGKLVRFVSFSVTTGFLSGVSVLLILNQLPVVTGYDAEGTNQVARIVDLLRNLDRLDWVSPSLAILTLILAVLLPRTPLRSFGRLVAIVIPSILVGFLALSGVDTVRDVGEIPRGLPLPSIPSLSDITLDVVTGALAVGIVVMVQGAGVSQSVPNPGGTRRSTSRDFVAQGIANVASGLFRGLPVGGSLSATALNVVYGAQSRWAVIFASLWMTVIVVVFPDLVSLIAMPALGALLILAGFSSLRPGEVRSIWNTGWTSRVAGIGTFLGAVFLSIQAAVGIGVLLSALLYVSRSATDITLVRLVRRPDDRIEERPAPRKLPSNDVVVLDAYGHLFYAGARTLENLLPDPTGASNPVVVLRLRSVTSVGATLLDVLAEYARRLDAVGGKLYLSGIRSRVHDQLVRTGKLHLAGPVHVYEATPIRTESTRDAVADARTWLVARSEN